MLQQLTRSSGVRLVMSGCAPSASSQPSSAPSARGSASAPLDPCWLLGIPHLHGTARAQAADVCLQLHRGPVLLQSHDLQATAPVARGCGALLLVSSGCTAAAPSPVIPDRVCSTTA